MADQTQLNDAQRTLMSAASARWDEVQLSNGDEPALLIAAALAAREALREGGRWPRPEWIEEILMIGANSCALGVLLHGEYPRLGSMCAEFYQEIVDRQWLTGGPSGRLEVSEVENLGKAASLRRLYEPAEPIGE